ncbi:TPA: TraR/DksA C4-type zinc finger protein [Escherichia coli]|uniref:TraR/DksA C4-type zinc finger protein n=2 Tax=Escherichia coli TaxID=562 RepID=UPI000BE35F67|nr:TraR/DksA C4-type zinc finger protein [Escherichia coli]MBS9316427.1 TraR/DksA C4-type zinc finger protein [Escherichia coli]
MDLVDIANEVCEKKLKYLLSNHCVRKKMVNYNKNEHCSSCGMEISESRLKIIPHAERCVTCQEIVENRLKHYKNSVT